MIAMDMDLQPEYKQYITDKNITVGNKFIYHDEVVEIRRFDLKLEIITVKHSDFVYSTFINEPFWEFIFMCEKSIGE